MRLFKRKETPKEETPEKEFTRKEMLSFLIFWNFKYPGMEGLYHEPCLQDVQDFIDSTSSPERIEQSMIAAMGVMRTALND